MAWFVLALTLANHLEGRVPLLIYRVAKLKSLMAELRKRGWEPDGEAFEISHGPCVIFRDPSGQRFALYELTLPEADAHLASTNREAT